MWFCSHAGWADLFISNTWRYTTACVIQTNLCHGWNVIRADSFFSGQEWYHDVPNWLKGKRSRNAVEVTVNKPDIGWMRSLNVCMSLEYKGVGIIWWQGCIASAFNHTDEKRLWFSKLYQWKMVIYTLVNPGRILNESMFSYYYALKQSRMNSTLVDVYKYSCVERLKST